MSALALVLVLLGLQLQWPLDHRLLAAEDARAGAELLVEALDDGPRPIQAIRALGRFERPELSRHVVPFLRAGDADTRIEAANALAQMGAPEPLAPYLAREETPAVRAALYEAIGRRDEAEESLFVQGLGEPEPARFGAAKGLESFLRLTERKPAESTVAAVESALTGATVRTRRLLLLSLLEAEAPPRHLLEAAFRDPDAQVRRLAVMGLAEYRNDPSYLVRYEALRAGFTCEAAEDALGDASRHVVLLAIDLLGNGCDSDSDSASLERLAASEGGWRESSHALVALAKTRPDAARALLPRFVSNAIWQARVYAAEAAKILEAKDALATLREDVQANVVAAALTTPEEALAALARDDYGLMMRALGMLEGYRGQEALPVYLATLRRVTSHRSATSRDPRRLLLDRLRESGVAADALSYLLDDFDPEIAAIASDITGRAARTERFAPAPVASESELLNLAGARARIRTKEAGSFIIELYPSVAPLTVAQFVRLAESGYYDGLTFHRVVPNFVLQGGSPGANEYVGRPEYIRDEVGTLSHERGTLGISTRGRDTGDSQIFINLVDNDRLDHNYTVFGRVVEGLANVDRILEGDVMERVEMLGGASHPGEALLELGGHSVGGEMAASAVSGKDPLESIVR